MRSLQKASKAKQKAKPDRSQSLSGKELLIWKAYQVFREKGYHATSMADLGEASGLLKGSIYHYFESKEDLMKQVLEAAYFRFKEDVFGAAYQSEIPAKMCLENMLAKTEGYFFDGAGGCLMGNIGLETAGRETSFTKIIHRFFEEWIEVFTHLYQAHYEKKQAYELAKQTVGDIQGAVMLACILKDKNHFSLTVERILRLLP
jgi:TetR/AcrR family transcriptional repressor of nem operon